MKGLLDAVIVPTVRPGLDCAARIAAGLDASLLYVRDKALAEARNTGLAAARAAGWQRVMFLDDDIDVSPAAVATAARALAGAQVAAFRATDFPDNSVIRHAARAGGMPAAVHPAGCAMLVNLAAVSPARSFPAIYNEDWLYMHGLAVAPAGECRQVPYQPFTPGRAAREELGDLIAEAVAGQRASTSTAFWETAIARRRELLARIAALPLPAAAAASVAEARQALSGITAATAAAFTTAWQEGLRGKVR